MAVKTRLVVSLALLFIVMAVGAFFALRSVYQLSNISTEISTNAMKRVELLSTIRTELAAHRGAELAYVLSNDAASAEQYSLEMYRHWQEIQQAVGQYRRLIDDPKRLADYEAFLLHVDDYSRYNNTLNAIQGPSRQQDVSETFASFQNAFNETTYHVERLRLEEVGIASDLSTVGQNLAGRSWKIFVGVALGVGLVVLLLGWYVWHTLSRRLNSLLEGTRRVSAGDLSKPVPAHFKDEFGEVGRSFNAMVDSLSRSQEENKRLQRESSRMQEQHIRLLRDSFAKVVKAQEEERQRVSRELHDEAGQALTGLHMGLERLERDATSDSMKTQITSLRTLTEETMDEIHSLALDMRPGSLDMLGLVPALNGYIKDFSKRVGVPVQLKVTNLDRRLPADMEVALFRVIQEGLTNVARHSKATRAWVDIEANGKDLKVTVRDNGVGFDIDKVMNSPERPPLGLFGMQERVALLGGTLKIESLQGGGTKLVVSVSTM